MPHTVQNTHNLVIVLMRSGEWDTALVGCNDPFTYGDSPAQMSFGKVA